MLTLLTWRWAAGTKDALSLKRSRMSVTIAVTVLTARERAKAVNGEHGELGGRSSAAACACNRAVRGHEARVEAFAGNQRIPEAKSPAVARARPG